MASFVLIHGSWHGGWCFAEVKALLEAAGHSPSAPLPGAVEAAGAPAIAAMAGCAARTPADCGVIRCMFAGSM